MLTPGKKLKDFIVYEYVLDKNLFWFRQIFLHLAETAPTKSGLKQKEPEIQKMRLKDSFDSPNGGTCEKTERGFCSSSLYGEKTLSVFQNSFSFAWNPSRKKNWSKWQKWRF
jgi:hypothetical protein